MDGGANLPMVSIADMKKITWPTLLDYRSAYVWSS